MKHFRILYRYEWKKLLGKKIVWISFLLVFFMLALAVFSPLFGGYYIEGKYMGTTYEMDQVDKAYAQALNGREIDQTLMEETIAAYRNIPQNLDIHYMATDEFQKYARPYSEIFIFLRRMSGMTTSELMYSWEPNYDDFAAKRQTYLQSYRKEARLSAGETDFWQAREATIKTPYVYEEHGGYSHLLSYYQTFGFFVLMLTAICLSGIFTDEHTRKTDQIVLCSPLGKTALYSAKIAVGISFAALSTALYLVFLFLSTLCLYGLEGYQAPYQFLDALSSDPVSCGQALLIAYGILFISAVVISVFVMVLSELLRSGIATLAISTGLLLLSMIFTVPKQYRVFSQIWDWLPWSFLSPLNVFGNYTVSVFGHYFTPWQAVPVIYLAVSVIIVLIGKPVYQRFQVSGR